MKHKHHIIPKHAGGSNDKSNIIELTIEEHANAHKLLFEQYGKIEDFIAWKMLSGKTEECELERIELAKQGFNNFMKSDDVLKWKNKISNSLSGKKQSSASKEKKSKSLKVAYSEGRHRNVFLELPKDVFIQNYIKHDCGNKMAEGRKKSKKWKDSVTSDEYKLKKTLSDPRSQKVIYDGIEYPSIRNAAKKLGISYSKMRSLLNKK